MTCSTPKSLHPWALAPEPGESQASLRHRRDQAYFEWQVEDNREFWDRIGPSIPLDGCHVLEIGCGHGALAVDMMRHGAAGVCGVDLDRDRVGFAKELIAHRYPAFSEQITLGCQPVSEIAGEAVFDTVVSKDSFEHIQDLSSLVPHIHRLLKPGGELIVGFSPLYFSPFGDHGEFLGRIPWLAAAMPEALLFRLASWKRGRRIRSAADVGLNKLTPAEFRTLFAPPRWRIESIRYNVGGRALLPVLDVLRRVPFLEKYATVSIYAVIRRV